MVVQPRIEGVMDTREESLRDEAESLLEFDRVREEVADHARMVMSRETISELHPAWHPDDVARLQDETAQARALLESVGDVGLAGLADIRPALRRVMLGGVLDTKEILEIRAVYEAVWTAKSTVERMGEGVPLLALQAEDIRDLRHISGDIDHAISPHGDILDRATPRLGRLRQRVMRSYRRLSGIMAGFTNSQDLRNALQSNVVGSRNDRLVLEVKSSFKSLVPGIVHGVSSTGQTVFVEPGAAIDVGNQWREAAAEAQREEEAVLRALSNTIAESAEDAMASVQAAATIDIAMARARYALSTGSARITVSAFEHDRARVSLVDARHPLLGKDAVPIGLRIDEGKRGLVITGPNTGGKTVAMKTLGLYAFMHQAGMQLPCNEATTLPIFKGIYADIGDAQSIDRSVSTFSSHMERVVNITRQVSSPSGSGDESDRPSALVLLDELGTGTDMEEGSALARAILDDLVCRGVWVCITTHHRAVAEFASAHELIQNASVEVDAETMMPNYNVIMGVHGRSYALHVARRLGLSDEVLECAGGFIDPSREEASRYLERVREDALRERETLAEMQREAAMERAAARESSVAAKAELEQAIRERESLVEEAREQLMREAQQVRRDLRRTMRQAKSKGSWDEARRGLDDVARPIRAPEWMARQDELDSQVADEQPMSNRREFQVGDLVRVPSLGVEGRLTGFCDDGRAKVSAGAMTFDANVRQMELVEAVEDVQEEESPPTSEGEIEMEPVYMASADLDVRGSSVHVVESILRQFIDRAFLQGLSSVRIIHGRGTGALREAVRDALQRESQVNNWHTASADQGGDSATIASLG